MKILKTLPQIDIFQQFSNHVFLWLVCINLNLTQSNFFWILILKLQTIFHFLSTTQTVCGDKIVTSMYWCYFLFKFLYLEKIGISERCRETEDEVTFRMFWDWLENSSVNNNQMFWSSLHWTSLEIKFLNWRLRTKW